MNKYNKYDICYVLADLLSTTPRALKYFIYLLDNKKKIHLNFNKNIKYADRENEMILSNMQEKYGEYFSYSFQDWTKPQIVFILYKFIFKLIWKFNLEKLFPNLSIHYYTLNQYSRTKNIKADIYIGHRPATLPIIVKLAQKHNAKSWFDVEDLHFSESQNQRENDIAFLIMQKYKTSFYTVASQLFTNQLKENLRVSNIEYVPNVPNVNLNINNLAVAHQELSIIWYSQTITFNRGLELLVNVINKIKQPFKLILIGNLDANFKKFLGQKNAIDKIKFKGYLNEESIHQSLLKSDIALCLDFNDQDVSRDLAEPNKLFSYLHCGNFILYNSTHGQKSIMNNYKDHGYDIENSSQNLLNYLNNIDLDKLRQNKSQRILNAKNLSWKNWDKKSLDSVLIK